MKQRSSILFILIVVSILGFSPVVFSQDSTSITIDTLVPASAAKKENTTTFSPRKATIRSAILPGWGQVYNKKYWKVPIVYSALGITGYIFLDNVKTYKDSRDAIRIRHAYSQPGATAADTIAFNGLENIYRIHSVETIRRQRDRFRQYIDYSVIFFVFFWGLNIVDATVDAHLKNFDVSPDLSFKIKAGHSEMARTNGLSLVLTIGKTKPAALLPSRF